MERLTRRLEDGEVITDCSGCKGNDGVPICHTIKCRNILKDRLADLEDKVEKGELAGQKWIPVTERLPKEHDSIFVKFYGTDSFLPGMFLTTSDDVIAAVTYEDGTRCTKVMRTQDGKWNLRYTPGAKRVTHWMPLPEPPKEGEHEPE